MTDTQLKEIPGMEDLLSIALDLRWAWSHDMDTLWLDLDPDLWESTHNAFLLLQTMSRDRLKEKLADPQFQQKLHALKATQERESVWFKTTYPDKPLTCVAYFSMEYMLSESLPIYVGGLGNVAGDQLKAADDLGVPVVAVGLLYQQGYFRQEIDKDGWQQELYPFNDPGQLPIRPCRLPNGEWLRIRVMLSGLTVWFRAWYVCVGQLRLYLLDSNDAANAPIHRGITSEVYGGGTELRIKQEILLGIGGWRLIKALGMEPDVCHLNEGHAAFLVLERALDFMKKANMPFEAALAATRAGNMFTSHTAVAAGFDLFTPSLVQQYLGAYAQENLGISFDSLMALGRRNAEDSNEPFNMAYLAIRGSGAVGGVSRLHGEVSRHLFSPLFPRWPAPEVPVGHVTNGVHTPSWDSEEADMLWTKAAGKNLWLGDTDGLQNAILQLPDEDFLKMRNQGRSRFVTFLRKRMVHQLTATGYPPDTIDIASKAFDPNTLTIGFARRFAEYKRTNLLLHDPNRLAWILSNTDRPVQLVIAGKAFPTDGYGKGLIHDWLQFIQQHNLYHKVAFLADYDMGLAEHLVQGVDVWLNNPRRPWEASGTSGMKVLVNGGLNCSELDGWWVEAYTPEVGWALGDGQEHGQDPNWDAREAEDLYNLLDQQIIPEFYAPGNASWVKKMRASMATLTPQFSANRTVREYTEKYYLPLAKEYKRRTGNDAGKRIIMQRQQLDQQWPGIRFGDFRRESGDHGNTFHLVVYLNGIDPAHVQVELYADAVYGHGVEKVPMRLVTATEGGQGTLYTAETQSGRAPEDYTPRIYPMYEGISIPLEDNRILWLH